jgi:hypothetical protein
MRLLSDLPADWAAEFLTTAQRLERAVERGLPAAGSMILVNNVVSQSVPHLHLHVIPRNPGDGLRLWLGPRHRYDGDHPAEEYAARIRAALQDLREQPASPLCTSAPWTIIGRSVPRTNHSGVARGIRQKGEPKGTAGGRECELIGAQPHPRNRSHRPDRLQRPDRPQDPGAPVG